MYYFDFNRLVLGNISLKTGNISSSRLNIGPNSPYYYYYYYLKSTRVFYCEVSNRIRDGRITGIRINDIKISGKLYLIYPKGNNRLGNNNNKEESDLLDKRYLKLSIKVNFKYKVLILRDGSSPGSVRFAGSIKLPFSGNTRLTGSTRFARSIKFTGNPSYGRDIYYLHRTAAPSSRRCGAYGTTTSSVGSSTAMTLLGPGHRLLVRAWAFQ
ncbi:hypothetical protein B0T13DRAFT_448907 [Neurospora crassa]|nr:hypothetical protein B0T13DRAFT_448907 [Neurospora crassa]